MSADGHVPAGGRCCRNCEYWDGGGEIAAKTALIGDCGNPNSDRFTPEWDHVCPAFYPDTTKEKTHEQP